MFKSFSFEIPESFLQDMIKDLESQGLKRTSKPIGAQIKEGEFCITETPSEKHPGERKLSSQGEPLWTVEVLKE